MPQHDIRDAFPSKYLKAGDLKGRALNVTIAKVVYEEVGQSRETKPVLYFVGKEKGMVLNKTNANVLMALTKSPITEEWHGTTITIYPSETPFQGEIVDCLRVKKDAPAARQALRRVVAQEPQPAPEPEPEPEPDEDFVPMLTDDDIPF